MFRRIDRMPRRVALAVAGLFTLLVFVSPGLAGAQSDADPPVAEAAAAGLTAPLIARQVLFGNPERAAARISPDGKFLAWLAPRDGVLNVWVAPVDDLDAARPVTNDQDRGIRSYRWTYTGDQLLYLQDKGGDENWRIYLVNLDDDSVRDLTPLEGVRAEIEQVSYKHPERILIGLNDRDEQLHDVYELDLRTGERELVQENPGYAGFLIDDNYTVRFGVSLTPDGGQEMVKKTEDGWEEFLSIGMEDALTTSAIGFDKDGDTLYMLDSRGRDTAAFKTFDIATGESTLIAEDDRADLSDLMMHPTEKTPQAVAFNYLRKRWKILDPAVEADLEELRKVADGEIEVTSRTLDDRMWVVVFVVDDGPVQYYLYNRDTKEARFLFTNRPELEGQPLVNMTPVVIEARDGLKLVSYLTLPPGSDADADGVPTAPVPMVLNVHGGPWARDVWGYDPEHQWLANRGYAVLSVNFRGSTGFGKAFLNAGAKEWGAKMQDDLTDAVRWAVERGIAQEDKVAIYGGSYGGYAVLAVLTFTPELYAAGVDIVGPSNLVTLLESIPPYWAPVKAVFTTRVGDPETEEGRALLEDRSPLNHVEKIERPLLIAQGANDPRVKQAESDQIVAAMEEKEIPVTYTLFPDEGHGFARPENRLAFYAVAEAFLAEVLGGRFEDVGDDFAGASITVPHGVGFVPGLEEAMASATPSAE